MGDLERAYEMGYRDAERSRPRTPERTASIREGGPAADHAAARDALGPAWLTGGRTLAEGIRTKTAFLERELARLDDAIRRAKSGRGSPREEQRQ